MSTHELKPGDRVRVTERCQTQGYHAGDKGTVLEGPPAGAGDRSYIVAMDKDGPSATTIILLSEEIEPDV
jgi:hypothetical protein